MKRKIEDGINNLSYDSVKNVTYDFELSDEAKERIYRNVLKRTGVEPKSAAKPEQNMQKKPFRINFKKPVVAAAAVVLALTVGVGSIVGAGALNKTFGQLFHSLPESNYKDVLFDINQTQTDNGITVTLTQGMCDGLSLYVIEKVEFDPSVVTLTDEMFDTSTNVYKAPYWSNEIVVNTKKTSEIEDNDLGLVSDLERAYSKLLERDEHSMTWLKVYGGEDVTLDFDSDFFKDGSQFTLQNINISNLPGMDAEDYKCSFEFTFDIKLCEPVTYTLPEEVYTYNESLRKEALDNAPDLYINPWYMRFSAGGFTGKILDTSLKGDKTVIEITLNDGTVYNEKNGIDVGGNPFIEEDLFGEDYNSAGEIYCTFDTEVDVTNIKSIKLYGYELKKGFVAISKNVRIADGDANKMNLPATSPVEFPDEEIEILFTLGNKSDSYYKEYGSFKYKINSVSIYDNLYATGVKSSDISSYLKYVGRQVVYQYDENGKLITNSEGYIGADFYVDFSDMCNEKTGELTDNCYLFEYEIELTNIDANFSEELSTFDYNNTSCFYDFFRLVIYDKNSATHRNFIQPAYLKENNRKLTGAYNTFKLKKGETKKFHVGFVVIDNNADCFEQMGVTLAEIYDDDSKVVFTNMTKAIEDFEKNK